MDKKPTTTLELFTELRGLVEWILKLCQDPHGWPLTDELRVQFLRSAYYQAKNLRDSEPFLRANVDKAAADLSHHDSRAELDRHHKLAADVRALLHNGGHGPNSSQLKRADKMLREIAGLPAE